MHLPPAKIHSCKLPLCALLFILMSTAGCNPVSIPLKGNYSTRSVEMILPASRDSIWSKLDNLFTANGLRIKNMDKEKGLIVTKETSFIPVYSFEDQEGQLEKKQAWVVMEKVFLKKKQWYPKTIHSKWSIQMTETGNGATTVKVDPVVLCTYYPNMITEVEIQGQSTGRLEALIISALSGH